MIITYGPRPDHCGMNTTFSIMLDLFTNILWLVNTAFSINYHLFMHVISN